MTASSEADMRVMFFVYLTIIVAGLVLSMLVGLLHA
jgi:hypothetical protein